MANQNPFLETFTLPHKAVPFSKIKPEHYIPALDGAIQECRENIRQIVESTQPPTFQNTVVALECCSDRLNLVSDVFLSLKNTDGTDAIQALAPQIFAKLTEISSEIQLNEKLFARIKTVFESPSAKNLSGEEKQLLDKTYKGFTRNGALLSGDKKQTLKKLDLKLAELSPKYSENLLKATNAYSLQLTHRDQLVGLPASLIETLELKAKEHGKTDGSWLVTLDHPIMVPFLQFSDRRDLRENVWRGNASKAQTAPYDNRPITIETATLRFQRAQLLGYPTHAHYVLEERMAQSPEKVTPFLDRLLSISKPAAENELKELQEFAASIGGPEELMPWDFSYYYEKLKRKKFDLDPEKLKEYFPFEKVLLGTFELASRLYDITLEKATDLEVYHDEVDVFRVFQKMDRKFVGLLYTDFFPRSTKQSGAWCGQFREQGLVEGDIQRPHISIVGSFTKPTSTRPSLLTWNEVQTLFHEFGHALHGLLSDCTYRSIAGLNVYWDFVELPSQFMENWTLEREVLDLISEHYKTKEKLPDEMAKKLKDESTFFAGYNCLRQLTFATLDMAWHGTDPSGITDVEKFENEKLAPTRILPHIKGTSVSPSFSHIFAGGYSAGYYSYKWAEVLDADAFEYFKTEGLFNPQVAEKFRQNILSRGGTEHPMDLYVKFRGREPDPDALLRRDGLIS